MTHIPMEKSREELEIENQNLQQENQQLKNVLEKTYHFLKSGSINSARKVEIDVFKRVCEVLGKGIGNQQEKEPFIKQGDEILYKNCVYRFQSFYNENLAIIMDYYNNEEISVDIDMLTRAYKSDDKVTLKSETSGEKYIFGYYSNTHGKAILYYDESRNIQDSFVANISNLTLVNN